MNHPRKHANQICIFSIILDSLVKAIIKGYQIYKKIVAKTVQIFELKFLFSFCFLFF